MGLITSLNLSNFSFHSFELAATSSDGLQCWLSALCLQWHSSFGLCCGNNECREELDKHGFSAVVLGMLGVCWGRADGFVCRLGGTQHKTILVFWVCRRFTAIYLVEEVPFPNQPNLSCTICWRTAGFAYSTGSFARKEWKVCQTPWITPTGQNCWMKKLSSGERATAAIMRVFFWWWFREGEMVCCFFSPTGAHHLQASWPCLSQRNITFLQSWELEDGMLDLGGVPAKPLSFWLGWREPTHELRVAGDDPCVVCTHYF